MKIAFTSCSHPFKNDSQPVWGQILAEKPDVLLLLGDAVYYDTDGISTIELQAMPTLAFAQRAHSLYQAQLNVPSFKKLIETTSITTYAIWDDHDFLGNGSNGADLVKVPSAKPLIASSTAIFKAFRNALAMRNASSFPTSVNNPNLVNPVPAEYAIGYSKLTLPGTNLRLHLTDGRAFRQMQMGREMLGAAQRAAIEADIKTYSTMIHLIASGVPFGQGTDRWKKYPNDEQWLLGLAKSYRCMLISGDIHDNDFESYASGGFPLHDATASGANVQTGVAVGRHLQNYGVLELLPDRIDIQIKSFGAVSHHFEIGRDNWQAHVV